MNRTYLLLLACACLALCPLETAGLRDQPRISCFVLGKVHPSLCPFTVLFREDPLFEYRLEPIPSGLSDDERRKYDRLYYPRNRNELLKAFDMIIFSDSRIQHFSPRQFHDLDYAFREAGMPSLYSFGPAWNQAFESSILREVLPISSYDYYYHDPHRVEFRREREPVLLPFAELGVEEVVGIGWAKATPRQGATVWADMVPVGYPWLISWKPGGSNPGITWVNGDEFDAFWWGLVMSARYDNPYGIDLAANIILYSLGRPLIQDVHARREARLRLSQHNSERLLVLSMLEWADRFGANTLSILPQLSEIDERTKEAMESYIEQDYAATTAIMGSISSKMNGITYEAVKLKDEALFWVYVIEWLVVTSAAIIAGVILWSLMIRRYKYRYVPTTKTRSTRR